ENESLRQENQKTTSDFERHRIERDEQLTAAQIESQNERQSAHVREAELQAKIGEMESRAAAQLASWNEERAELRAQHEAALRDAQDQLKSLTDAVYSL